VHHKLKSSYKKIAPKLGLQGLRSKPCCAQIQHHTLRKLGYFVASHIFERSNSCPKCHAPLVWVQYEDKFLQLLDTPIYEPSMPNTQKKTYSVGTTVGPTF